MDVKKGNDNLGAHLTQQILHKTEPNGQCCWQIMKMALSTTATRVISRYFRLVHYGVRRALHENTFYSQFMHLTTLKGTTLDSVKRKFKWQQRVRIMSVIICKHWSLYSRTILWIYVGNTFYSHKTLSKKINVILAVSINIYVLFLEFWNLSAKC